MADENRPAALRAAVAPTRRDVAAQLPRDAQSPAIARQLVRQLCAETAVSDVVIEVAVLLTSETVTNSVLHGRGRLLLRLCVADGRLRVEVADRSRRSPVTPPVDEVGENGRGVRLLQECASSWGVDVRGRGKTVWFELTTG